MLLFAFSDTLKMQSSKTKLSVLNPMNSLQSNQSYKWCSKYPASAFTLAVEYATDNHQTCFDKLKSASMLTQSKGDDTHSNKLRQYYGTTFLRHNIARLSQLVAVTLKSFFAIETPLFSGNFSRKCCIVIGQCLCLCLSSASCKQ